MTSLQISGREFHQPWWLTWWELTSICVHGGTCCSSLRWKIPPAFQKTSLGILLGPSSVARHLFFPTAGRSLTWASPPCIRPSTLSSWGRSLSKKCSPVWIRSSHSLLKANTFYSNHVMLSLKVNQGEENKISFWKVREYTEICKSLQPPPPNCSSDALLRCSLDLLSPLIPSSPFPSPLISPSCHIPIMGWRVSLRTILLTSI